MEALVADFDLCVDATHPYAVQASANIRAACEKTGVALRRALRPASDVPADSVTVPTATAAAAFLESTQGNVLLTTGAKELAAFSSLERDRLYARVLPTLASIAACEEQAIPHSNIVAMQGPFSCSLNEAMIRQFSIQWLVTKDGEMCIRDSCMRRVCGSFCNRRKNMAFEHYIQSGGQRLRCGYTTGTCAALAAAGAAQLLLSGKAPAALSLMTPKGLRVTVEPEYCRLVGEIAFCAVRKDGGDDADVYKRQAYDPERTACSSTAACFV